MLKILAKTFLGLLLTLGGFFLVFYYLMGLDSGRSILFLIPALPFIPLGIFLLLKAGASEDTVVVGRLDEPVKNGDEKKSILEKNNELSEEWSKTVEKRDKLKLLSISAAGEEQS